MITLKSVTHDEKWNSIEATWVDGDDAQVKCHSYADVQMQMFRDDVAELGGDITEYETLITLVESKIVPPEPVPIMVPQEVSTRQGCLVLDAAGLLDDVELIVATLPRHYQIEWQRASVIRRDNPLVEIVRQQQGLTVEAIDQLFITANTL